MRYVTKRPGRSGPRWYWQRKGYPLVRLPDDPAERWHEVERLNRQADGEDALGAVEGSIAWLVEKYRQSGRYKRLAYSTRRNYERWLAYFEETWGGLPPSEITRRVVVDFADTLADRPSVCGQAIAALTGVLNLSVYHGMTESNPCHKLGLQKGPRRDVYWQADDIARFLNACEGHRYGAQVRIGFQVMLYTAQRPGDALALPRTAYNGQTIRLRQQKTRKLVEVPAHVNLRAVLDGLDHDSTRIVPFTGTGKPLYNMWNTAYREILKEAKLEGLQARDLRRTAVVNMSEAGCSIPEIAAVTGHSIERTREIVETYFVRTLPMAESAMAKWEGHKPRKKSNIKPFKSGNIKK